MAEKITSDVYDISSMINTIQSKFNSEIKDDTLLMGIFGHITESLTKISQNSVISATENGNEAVYLRSKFERTILSNAVFFDVDNINATPAKMNVMIGFLESDLITHMGTNEYVIIDKTIPIMIDDFEFHLDYDIHISRTQLNDGSYVYSARYILDGYNPISDITNPFLSSPIQMSVNYSSFIFINCDIRQIYVNHINTVIKSDIFIENKTYDFDFENQLAYFYVSATENGKTTVLTPVFDNMPPDTKDYCFYRYTDEDSIRIKFDRKSYTPTSTANLDIIVCTTKGAGGNFPYVNDIQLALSSDKYGYDNFMCLIRPVSDSENGLDKKSIDELKLLIPKQAVSRKVISKNIDIENYFNDLDNYKLYFYKKRHNLMENLFYAYILMMDSSNNIIPTNTVDIILNDIDFDMINEDRYILTQGKMIEYNDNGSKVLHGVSETDELALEKSNFIYSIPFTTVINTEPALTLSYYCTNVSNKNYLNYNYINLQSNLQFICDYMTISRHYLENEDNYICDISILQNINKNFDLVSTQSDKIVGTKLKAMMTINDGDGEYYVEGELIEYDATNFVYKIRFILDNDNMINMYNSIRINKVKKIRTDNSTYSYFGQYLDAKIYIYLDSDTYYGNNGIDLFPSMAGYTLTNIYSTIEKLELFVNYSQTVNSTVKTIQNTDGSTSYKITSVPVMRYSYINNIKRNKEFLSNLALKKAYIDNTLDIIENPFSIDLKFFNTYGKSKLFYIGHNKEILDRVNLSLKFRVKLVIGSDNDIISYIKNDIKSYIENINQVTSQHMNAITTQIQTKYNSNIEFIEFVGINDYDATYQYLEKIDVSDVYDVPEFINVNSDDYSTPDIEIIVV